MSRSTGLMMVAVFSGLAMVLLANSPSAEASGNCEGKLFGNSYDCSFKDNHSPFDDCFEFGSIGISQFFDLGSDAATWGCACNPTGSVNSPSFNGSSSTFECSDDEAPFLVNGKIKGKKLSVQGIGATGEQYIGTCTLRSTPCF